MKEGRSWNHDPGNVDVRGAWNGESLKQPFRGARWDEDRDLVHLLAEGGRAAFKETTLSGNRIRVWLAQPNLGAIESMAERGIRAVLQTHAEATKSLSHIGQVHYSLRAWVVRTLNIEQEVLQTPFTMSRGTFPESPRLDNEAVAIEDRKDWGLEGDDVTSGGPEIR